MQQDRFGPLLELSNHRLGGAGVVADFLFATACQQVTVFTATR